MRLVLRWAESFVMGTSRSVTAYEKASPASTTMVALKSSLLWLESTSRISLAL